MSQLRTELAEIQKKVGLYLSVGRFDAAEKLLRATLADYGSLANIHNLLGVTFHKQSKFSDALKEFTKAIKANPQFVEAALNLSATYCDLSRYDEAREVFSGVVSQINPRKRLPDLVLGRLANQHARNGALYEQSGMLADAIQEYRRALALFPKMPDVQIALGKLYFRSGQTEKAQREFEDLIRGSTEIPEANTWLGIIYYKLGRREDARRQWEKAQAVQPSNPAAKAYMKLARDWTS